MTKSAMSFGGGKIMLDIWKMPEAPIVRNTISQEEKIEKQQTILDKGVYLFAGKVNESYVVDINLLTEDGAFGLMHQGTKESHPGWPIIRFQGTVGGTPIQISDEARTVLGQSEVQCFQFLTVKTILEKLKLESITELEVLELAVENEGYIKGLYWLPKEVANEMQGYLDEVKDYEKVIHTYDGELSDKNALPCARKLYSYLKSVYGKKCLLGQQESFWRDGPDYEMKYIEKVTGKLPAIRGMDFIANTFEDVVRRSREWWSKGGIVTICWHTGPDFQSDYEVCIREEFDWTDAFVPGTKQYMHLLEGMDRAVPYLKQLADENIPVLWRPFHEFDGHWFWWSKGGAENFKKLWQMMHSRYTEHWGLHNLIWVLGYGNNPEDKGIWYPGDKYVDISGADNYERPDGNVELYRDCVETMPEGMPLANHECGVIPSEEAMKEAPWLYVMPWYNWIIGEECAHTPEQLHDIYNSDYFITLDELPKLKEK